MSRRTQRVGELLQAEISQLLLRSAHDPRLRMASIAAVDVSPDLRRAVVRVSVLDESQREESLAALRHAAGFLRRELAHKLRHMRVLPELIFAAFFRKKEAGGVFTDLQGEPPGIATTSVLAATPGLHGQLLEMLSA